MSSAPAAATATLAAVSVTAVTCGAAAIIAVLVSQQERTEARLSAALEKKEEQLAQAVHERTRLSDQLNEERNDRRLDAERALVAARRGAGPPPTATSSGSRMGGRNVDAPKPLALDPRMLGLVPRSSTASSSPAPPSATTTPTAAASSTDSGGGGGAPPESPYHMVTPTHLQAAEMSAAAELGELKQADVDGVVGFLHVRLSPPQQRPPSHLPLPLPRPPPVSRSRSRRMVLFFQRHNLSEHEALFRQQKVQGTDLSDVLEPDRHGFSVEQKLGCAVHSSAPSRTHALPCGVCIFARARLSD